MYAQFDPTIPVSVRFHPIGWVELRTFGQRGIWQRTRRTSNGAGFGHPGRTTGHPKKVSGKVSTPPLPLTCG